MTGSRCTDDLDCHSTMNHAVKVAPMGSAHHHITDIVTATLIAHQPHEPAPQTLGPERVSDVPTVKVRNPMPRRTAIAEMAGAGLRLLIPRGEPVPCS